MTSNLAYKFQMICLFIE